MVVSGRLRGTTARGYASINCSTGRTDTDAGNSVGRFHDFHRIPIDNHA